MIRAVDMGSVFALARYAAEKTKPLVDQIPGGSLGVAVNTDDKWMREPWHVEMVVHRVLAVDDVDYLCPVVFQKSCLANTEDVDHAIANLKAIVDGQKWKPHEFEKDAA